MDQDNSNHKNIYRVIDVCNDSKLDRCYIYTRNNLHVRHTILMNSVYEVIVGTTSDDQMNAITLLMHNISDIYQVSMRVIGEQQTYYRGNRLLVLFSCKTFVIYSGILNKIKYNYRNYFLCENATTIESKTLERYGIYGATYVYHDGNILRVARKEEQFEYVPVVAGIDLEMLSLNPVDPSCVLYMGSYYSKQKTVVIYTSEYCCNIESNKKITYIRVADKYELAQTLSNIIAHEQPDIVTGYNIYIADMPLLYFVMRSHMNKWQSMCHGPDPFFQYTRKLNRGFVDSDSGIVIKIPGCHVVDMYFYLDHILPSEEKSSLKLSDVSTKYISQNKDPFTYRDLNRIYHEGTTEEKMLVMKYCIRDSYLSVQLYMKFNVWNYHSSMYSISCVDPQRSACTGAVDVTYGMCYIKSKNMKIYLDEPNNAIFSPSGGLVLKGQRGIFSNVHCIDFTSLYPSITIEHNIDSLSVVKLSVDEIVAKHGQMMKRLYYSLSEDGKIVGLTNRHGQPMYFDLTVTTIVPSVLVDLLNERDLLKKQLKVENMEQSLKLSLSGQEQARKIGANGTCGALAEQTPGNPVSYCELNDIITSTGRTILSFSQDIAREQGLMVIYGDTDSLILNAGKQIDRYLETVHAVLPNRIRFKVEYVADKFIMGMKKHYIAKIGDNVKIMGYKAVKSSSCKAAQTLFRWLVDELLLHGPELIMYHYEYMLNLYDSPSYEIDPELFTYRFSYSGKTYVFGTYRQKVISSMIERGVELIAGNTLTVITVKSLENFVQSYGVNPPIRLPLKSEGKSARLYTIDEIGTHHELVDVRDILEVQCGSDIKNIMQSINSN
jgi:DNA polymerase elongation subunit (family B)